MKARQFYYLMCISTLTFILIIKFSLSEEKPKEKVVCKSVEMGYNSTFRICQVIRIDNGK